MNKKKENKILSIRTLFFFIISKGTMKPCYTETLQIHNFILYNTMKV